MKQTSTDHETLIFERTVPASPEQVFAAFADPDVRARWSAPTDTAGFIYDKTNFKVGGFDTFRCGPKNNLKYHGTTHYLEITNNQRIVSTETMDSEGKRFFASLTTLELVPISGQTKLKTTVQVVSFVGPDMFKGHTDGHNGSLDNLVRYFATSH